MKKFSIKLSLAFATLLFTANCGFFWNEVSKLGKSKDDSDLITLALLANASRGSGSLGNLSPEELVTALSDITKPLGQASVTSNVATTAGNSAVGVQAGGNTGNQGGGSEAQPSRRGGVDLEKWAQEGFDPYALQKRSSPSGRSSFTRNTEANGITYIYTENTDTRRSGTFSGSQAGINVNRTEADQVSIYKANGRECIRINSQSNSNDPQGLATFTNGEFTSTSGQNQWSGTYKADIAFDNFGSFYVDPVVLIVFYKAMQDSNLYTLCDRQVNLWDSENRITTYDFIGNRCSCDVVNSVFRVIAADLRATIDGSIRTESTFSNQNEDTWNTVGDTTNSKFRYIGKESFVANSPSGIRIRKSSADSGMINLQNLRYTQDYDFIIESSYREIPNGEDQDITEYTLFRLRGFFRLRIQGNINGNGLNESLNLTF